MQRALVKDNSIFMEAVAYGRGACFTLAIADVGILVFVL